MWGEPLRIQITTRHCDVPEDVLERTQEQVASLAKFDPRATSAEVVFEEEKATRRVEIIVHCDGADPVIGRAEEGEFREALDRTVDRVGRMLRDRRKRQREHKAPPLQERVAKD